MPATRAIGLLYEFGQLKMGVVLIKWAWPKMFTARFARTISAHYCYNPTIVIILDPPLLTATYIILKSKVRYHRGLHGVENALFKSYGVIYLPWLSSTLPDKLSTDIRNSSRFLSRQRVSTFNNSFCKITDSSLFSPKELLSFLAYFCNYTRS